MSDKNTDDGNEITKLFYNLKHCEDWGSGPGFRLFRDLYLPNKMVSSISEFSNKSTNNMICFCYSETRPGPFRLLLIGRKKDLSMLSLAWDPYWGDREEWPL